MSLTGGNRNDVTQLLPLLDKIPPVAGVVGRPRRRPDMLFADRGYDHDKYRRLLRQRGIRPAIAERGQPHGTGLGTFRWVVERTISWLHGFRRLRIRWERRDDIHEAFLGLAVCLITHRHVQRLRQGQLACSARFSSRGLSCRMITVLVKPREFDTKRPALTDRPDPADRPSPGARGDVIRSRGPGRERAPGRRRLRTPGAGARRAGAAIRW
ncbi:transposase [Streptomyces sp. SAI-135]|nr:transposase [Streptomyces sp. SAI-090]MDH6545937.1 transposase [Streptomyces sp. SAI-041]MDH6622156.1 transposase [Streptomyces sp. SAI-135]